MAIRYTEPTLFLAGKTGKPHGVKGELSASLTIDGAVLLDQKPFLFLEEDGLPIPYRLSQIREKGQSYLLTLDGIDSIEKAQPYTQANIYLPAELLDSNQVSYTWDHFEGFQLFDQDRHAVGTIDYIDDSTANLLCHVTTPEDRHLLIPIHEDLIQEIDTLHRTIAVQIPDGLLSL